MSCQEISMAEQYVDGELDVTEQSRYEKHLSTCTVCQQEVDSLRELLTGLRALSVGEAPQTSWEDIVFQLQVAPPKMWPLKRSSRWSIQMSRMLSLVSPSFLSRSHLPIPKQLDSSTP